MPVLSWDQVAAVVKAAGWPVAAASVAVAITMPESSRDSGAIQQGVPYAEQGWGLWQITPGNSVPQFGINSALLDPLNNSRAALFKYRQAGYFGPWTTWTSGKFEQWMPAAEAAVSRVWTITPARLSAIVAAARQGAPAAPTSASGASDWSSWVSYAAGRHGAFNGTLASSAAALNALRGHARAPAVRPGPPGQYLIREKRILDGRRYPHLACRLTRSPADHRARGPRQRPGLPVDRPLRDRLRARQGHHP